MKRTPLTRKTPMPRGKPLRRTQFRAKRSKRNESVHGQQARLCETLPCAVCQCPPIPGHVDVVAHHVKTVGAGGKDGDCAPLCPEHHQLVHHLPPSEWKARGLPDLREVADALALHVGGGCP